MEMDINSIKSKIEVLYGYECLTEYCNNNVAVFILQDTSVIVYNIKEGTVSGQYYKTEHIDDDKKYIIVSSNKGEFTGELLLSLETGKVLEETLDSYVTRLDFDKDIFCVRKKNDGHYILNLRNGKYTKSETYDHLLQLDSEGYEYIVVVKNELCGTYNYIEGIESINPIYDEIYEYTSAGVVLATNKDKKYVVGADGRLLYDDIKNVEIRNYIVEIFRERYKTLLYQGKMVYENIKQYDWENEYGFLKIRVHQEDGRKLVGGIDLRNMYVIPEIYDDVTLFSATNRYQYKVKKDGLYGTLTVSGKESLDISYNDIYVNDYHYIITVKNNINTVYDYNGNVVIKNDGKISIFSKELFVLNKQGKSVVINKGRVIVEYNDEVTRCKRLTDNLILICVKKFGKYVYGVRNDRGGTVVSEIYDKINLVDGKIDVLRCERGSKVQIIHVKQGRPLREVRIDSGANTYLTAEEIERERKLKRLKDGMKYGNYI